MLTAALVTGALLAQPVAAAEEDSEADGILNGMFESDEETSRWEQFKSGIDRLLGGLSGSVDRLLDYKIEHTASEAADDVTETFNANNRTIESYVNAHATASTSADVLELTFDIGDEQATRYLVADVNGPDYEHARIVTETTRSPDESCTLDQQAADNAAAELETFIDEYADPDKNVSAGYESDLTSQYAGEVHCSFLPGGDA